MKRVLSIIALVSLAGVANAEIPMMNATCPGNLEVHTDEGGPLFINGKEAKMKKINDNYLEAKGSGVTVSLSLSPDGTPSISYTGKGGANGMCEIAEED